jgi:hypothetical protein
MSTNKNWEEEQAAYERLKDTIKATYPKGWFVAIHGGKIVADAATFDEIDQMLTKRGIPQPEGLVVQVGVEYLDNAIILPLE